MSRAEIRRAEKKKSKKPTYNLTEEQIDILVKERVKDTIKNQLAKVKQEATEDAINTAMVLTLALPLEVLMDHYWQKSYAKRIPEFTNYILEYFHKWENGELDMNKLQEDLWEYGGVKIEKTEDFDT